MPKLISLIETRTEWKELGLPYYGHVRVDTTDPTKSNSGNMFAALFATMLNQGGIRLTDHGQPEGAPAVRRVAVR